MSRELNRTKKKKGLINSVPNNKFLGWSKFKAFADDKINVTEKLKFGLEEVEKVVGKGENASYWHFLLSPKCFQKSFFPGSLRDRIVR